MRGVVIGNGISRRGFDLNQLTGITLGCNSLYKHYKPDYLVAIDTVIRAEIEALGKTPWKWVSRKFDKNAVVWITEDDKPVVLRSKLNGGLNNNSGVLAAAYAAEILEIKELYLLGIDFFRPVPDKSNDMYGPSTFGTPALTTCWNRLIERNPQTKFIRVGPIHERDLDYYTKELCGFEYIEYEDFVV
jgi:hypothetical protein